MFIRYSLNDDKLRSLGWEPKKIFDEEIVEIVEHYKHNNFCTDFILRLDRRAGNPPSQHAAALDNHQRCAALSAFHLLDDLEMHLGENAAFVVALAGHADDFAVHHRGGLGRQRLDRQRHLACRLAKRGAGQQNDEK